MSNMLLRYLIPQIHILALSPHPFTTQQAMKQTYKCVKQRVYGFLQSNFDALHNDTSKTHDADCEKNSNIAKCKANVAVAVSHL